MQDGAHFPHAGERPCLQHVGGVGVVLVELGPVGGGAKTEDGKTMPMDVKVGDKVLFGKWSGTEVKIDGKEYSIMKESDIMGISSK